MYASTPEVAEDVFDEDLPQTVQVDTALVRRTRLRAGVQLLLTFACFFTARMMLEWAGLYRWVERHWPAGRIAVLVFSQATVGTLVTYLVLRGFSERAASIGFERPNKPWRELGRGLLTVVAVYAMQLPVALAVMLLLRGPTRQQMVLQKTQILGEFVRMPVLLILPCAVAAGLYEELLVRGLIQSRVSRLLSGSDHPTVMQRSTAVLLGAALFAAGHWYQGPVGVAQTLFAGLVFGACTAYWRSLWPAIVAHTLIDTVSLTVAHFVVPAAQRMLAR
jgi:membrane protease YdiL (CAAX protease family)